MKTRTKSFILSFILVLATLIGLFTIMPMTASAASDTITVTGLTAPQAGQTVEGWWNSIPAPVTLSGGVTWMGEEAMLWIEGEYDNGEDAVAALDANGPFEGTFEKGKKYTFYAGVVPGGGELPAAATVVASGASNTAYQKVEEALALLFLTYTVETPTITITGLTAPQAGQSAAAWLDDNSPVFSPDYDWGGGYWFEGAFDEFEELPDLDTDRFLGNFVSGQSYTLYLWLESETPTLPQDATLNVPGATSAVYDYFGEEDGWYYADIMIVYTVGEGTPTDTITVSGITAPTDGTTVDQWIDNFEEPTFTGADVAFDDGAWFEGKLDSPAQFDTAEFASVFRNNSQYTLVLIVLGTLPTSAEVTAQGTSATGYYKIPDEEAAYIFLTYTAEGTSTTWTVIFDAGEGSGSMDFAKVNKGEGYTLPACTFTAPEGYTFKCWSIGGVDYAPGATVTINDNTEILAVWKGAVTDMTLSADSVRLDDLNSDETNYEYTFTLTVNPTDANAKIDVTYDSSRITVTKSAIVDGVMNVTVKSKYYPGAYPVTFTAIGEEGTITKTFTVYVKEQTPDYVTLNEASGYLTGFKWENGEGVKYTVVVDLEKFDYFFNENVSTTVEIKPEWVGKTIYVYKANANEGANSDPKIIEIPADLYTCDVILPESPVSYEINLVGGSTVKVDKGGSFSFSVNILEGYRTTESFKVLVNGYKLDPVSANDGVYTYTIEDITESKTISVEGIEKISFWVSCQPGPYASETKKDIQKYYGEDVTLPGAIFTRTDYTMIGWSTDSTATEAQYPLNGTYTADEAVTLFPVWQATHYAVTFAGKNYTHNGSDKAAIGSDYVVTFTPAAGYEIDIADIVVKVKNSTIYGKTFDDATDTLTIPAEKVTGIIEISVTPDEIVTAYDVIFTGENYTHNGSDKAAIGSDYVVTFTPAVGYDIDNKDK